MVEGTAYLLPGLHAARHVARAFKPRRLRGLHGHGRAFPEGAIEDRTLAFGLGELLAIRGEPLDDVSFASELHDFGLVVVFVILFFVLLLRRNWLGFGVAWLLFAGFFLLRSIDFGIAAALTVLLVPTVVVLVAVRFGPLALMVLLLIPPLRAFFPITTELSAWYSTNFVLAALVILVVTAYGFYTSLGGQPLLRGRFLEEN